MSNNNSNNCAGGSGTINSNGWYTITIPSIDYGSIVINVDESSIKDSSKKSDGCNCKKCKEFYPYAEPNQDDGTLICYGCRNRW